jgi:hypothetical protein
MRGLIGTLVSYYFFRVSGSARQKIYIELNEIAHIDPAAVGVQVKMKIDTTEVSNLLVLEAPRPVSGCREA